MAGTVSLIAYNEWLYVFGFATHILPFKAQKPIGKTDIYNVLAFRFLLVINLKSILYEQFKRIIKTDLRRK